MTVDTDSPLSGIMRLVQPAPAGSHHHHHPPCVFRSLGPAFVSRDIPIHRIIGRKRGPGVAAPSTTSVSWGALVRLATPETRPQYTHIPHSKKTCPRVPFTSARPWKSELTTPLRRCKLSRHDSDRIWDLKQPLLLTDVYRCARNAHTLSYTFVGKVAFVGITRGKRLFSSIHSCLSAISILLSFFFFPCEMTVRQDTDAHM